ncbi:AIG2-like family protein [Metarhizium robertsii]|uniref:gamma-glutamylcyclotransferase n=1 Tax=Metarhizium robertsii TaxID=568076 RepID=A0A0A1UT64_9HYPO|nr:AIG2-like family protein [Metarhizium robertsii]
MTMDTTTGPDGPAWYFGYGANMAASVFIERRKIRPLRTEVAYIPSHALCFNVLGIPYVDPGNGGIRPLCPETTDPTACVHGVAYLLTPEDLKKVVLSEGGGIAYNVVKLNAKLLQDGSTIQVNTLMGRHNVAAQSERLPSTRYIGVLTRGAHEQNLPQWYQQKLAKQPTYQPKSGWWFQLGVTLFLWPWTRAGVITERLVYKYQGSDGHVPAWFLFIFDCLLRLMWAQHDYFHGPIFGRGDGR